MDYLKEATQTPREIPVRSQPVTGGSVALPRAEHIGPRRPCDAAGRRKATRERVNYGHTSGEGASSGAAEGTDQSRRVCLSRVLHAHAGLRPSVRVDACMHDLLDPLASPYGQVDDMVRRGER